MRDHDLLLPMQRADLEKAAGYPVNAERLYFSSFEFLLTELFDTLFVCAQGMNKQGLHISNSTKAMFKTVTVFAI